MPAADIFDTQGIDPQEYRKKLAMGLMQSGMDVSPVRSWTQGAARMAQALAGGLMMNQAQAQQSGAYGAIADVLDKYRPQSGQAMPAAGAPPTAGTPAVAPTAVPQTTPAGDTSQPRGLRNNNPGNIEDGPFAKSLAGYAGSDGRFAKFASLDHGIGAMDNLLQNYGKQGINTVSDVINRWAPPSDNNPTTAYADTVAGGMGVKSTDPINLGDPATRGKLALGIAKFENGKPLPQDASLSPQPTAGGTPQPSPSPSPQQPQQPQQVAQAQPTAGIHPDMWHATVTLLRSGEPNAQRFGANLANVLIGQQLEEPKPMVVTDAFGGQKVVLVHPASGTISAPQSTGTGATGGFGGTSDADAMSSAIIDARNKGATKEQLYSLVPPAYQEGVKAMVEGRSLPTNMSMRSQARTSAVMLAHSIDPTFDEDRIVERQNFARSMGSLGLNQFGGQVKSSGTIMKHLGDANDALTDIQKTAGAFGPGEYPMLNQLALGMKTQAGGDPQFNQALGKWKGATEGLSGELVQLLTGGVGAEHSKQEWRNKLDISKNALSDIKGQLDEIRSLMYGRLSNVAQAKERAFGVPTDPTSLLGKDEQAIAKRLQAGLPSNQQTQSTQPQQPQAIPQGQPSKSDIEAEMRRRGLL